MLLHLAAESVSKVPFYVAGGLLAGWAVLIGVLGIKRPSFPGGQRGGRVVMALSALLVAAAMATAVITS